MNIPIENIFSCLILGSLASFSPCNLPLAPILLAQINEGDKKNNGYFFISGILLANSTVGIMIAIFNKTFVQVSQSNFIQVIFASILFASVLYGLGFIPQKYWDVKFSPKNNWVSIVIYGAICGFALSPCTTAPMVAAINLSLHEQSFFAVITMLAFGIGSITSLVLLNAGINLKPGKWLLILQQVMLFFVLLIAINIIINIFSISSAYSIFISLIVWWGLKMHEDSNK